MNILLAHELEVKRRPETLKWDRELYEAMNCVPWSIDGLVARPEAGWTPTPGCKACDEESTGVKRRGRPYNHTPECLERQAVSREQLRTSSELQFFCGSSAPHGC